MGWGQPSVREKTKSEKQVLAVESLLRDWKKELAEFRSYQGLSSERDEYWARMSTELSNRIDQLTQAIHPQVSQVSENED